MARPFTSDFRLQPPIHQREERKVNRHPNSHRRRRARSHLAAVVEDLEGTLISDLDGTFESSRHCCLLTWPMLSESVKRRTSPRA